MSRRDENILGAVGTGRVTVTTGAGTGDKKQGIAAAGGLLGAIAASSCCVVPLVLFSLGVSAGRSLKKSITVGRAWLSFTVVKQPRGLWRMR